VDQRPPEEDRASGMRIDFTLSIGYTRRRPDTQGDRWEARLDSVGLLLVGAVVAVVILIVLVPRILALFVSS
jgi:hypothetical protein